MKKYTDEEIWSLCLLGRADAFEELYKRYYALLYNYGYKYIPDKELVPDIIHELFLKLMSNRASLSSTSFTKGYLLRAFRNKIYDTLERQKNEPFFRSSYLEIADFTGEECDDSGDEVKVMLEAYEELTAKQKEVIYLYFIQNFSHSDIAEVLKINCQSSKNLLHRSLVSLRTAFYKKK